MHPLLQQLICLSFLCLSLLLNTASSTVHNTSLPNHRLHLRQSDRPKLGNVPYGQIIRTCTTLNTIALTFDDGPSPFTPLILDALSQYPNAKATFFVNGDNFGRGRIDDPSLPWPATVRRMHAAGHQVGNHGWSHADLTHVSSDVRYDEVLRVEEALANILGFYPAYFRPPYGLCDTTECMADLGEMGYHVVNFDVDTKDFEHDSGDLATGIQWSKDIFGTWAREMAIVLAHDVYNETAETLVPYMLEVVAERGWRMVTVGECLGDPAENWYRS
ncbi:carbohydrate esterase family 4 protein [Coniochaeta sp. 2T2.1]|nr:carbohydrate esterase family 4 protein [Coniochaeta sp. 2T2.1]